MRGGFTKNPEPFLVPLRRRFVPLRLHYVPLRLCFVPLLQRFHVCFFLCGSCWAAQLGNSGRTNHLAASTRYLWQCYCGRSPPPQGTNMVDVIQQHKPRAGSGPSVAVEWNRVERVRYTGVHVCVNLKIFPPLVHLVRHCCCPIENSEFHNTLCCNSLELRLRVLYSCREGYLVRIALVVEKHQFYCQHAPTHMNSTAATHEPSRALSVETNQSARARAKS